MLTKLKQMICRHSWSFNNAVGNKRCTKCNKVEEVYMGWV